MTLLSILRVKGNKMRFHTFILVLSETASMCSALVVPGEKATPSLRCFVIGALSLVSPMKFNDFHLINYRNETQS